MAYVLHVHLHNQPGGFFAKRTNGKWEVTKYIELADVIEGDVLTEAMDFVANYPIVANVITQELAAPALPASIQKIFDKTP